MQIAHPVTLYINVRDGHNDLFGTTFVFDIFIPILVRRDPPSSSDYYVYFYWPLKIFIFL
jgi:hypothetical protein